jgi:ribosome-binding protein aMBF1 (putative translation factor)
MARMDQPTAVIRRRSFVLHDDPYEYAVQAINSPRTVSEYQKPALDFAQLSVQFLKFRNNHHERLLPMPPFRNSETLPEALNELGEIIRRRRKDSGLRIDDAAALSGVSVDLLSRLENGKSGVATDRLLKVLDALGLALRVVDKTSGTIQRAPEVRAAK